MTTAATERRQPEQQRLHTIGAVCARLQPEFPDISISKIRYLEDQGLLAPRRTQSGYRLFSEDDVERLETILRLQRDEFLPLRVIRQELASPSGAGKERRRRRAVGLADQDDELDLSELSGPVRDAQLPTALPVRPRLPAAMRQVALPALNRPVGPVGCCAAGDEALSLLPSPSHTPLRQKLSGLPGSWTRSCGTARARSPRPSEVPGSGDKSGCAPRDAR